MSWDSDPDRMLGCFGTATDEKTLEQLPAAPEVRFRAGWVQGFRFRIFRDSGLGQLKPFLRTLNPELKILNPGT